METRNVFPIVNGRCSYGSVLTTAPRINDIATPMTIDRPAKMAVARTERSLIHSLRIAARRSRMTGDGVAVERKVAVVVVVVVFIGGPFGVVSGQAAA